MATCCGRPSMHATRVRGAESASGLRSRRVRGAESTSGERRRREWLRRSLIVLALAVSACGGANTTEESGKYPERDVTMIVPFGAGGGSDVLSRTIANVI